jgi:hypothetical protein
MAYYLIELVNFARISLYMYAKVVLFSELIMMMLPIKHGMRCKYERKT